MHARKLERVEGAVCDRLETTAANCGLRVGMNLAIVAGETLREPLSLAERSLEGERPQVVGLLRGVGGATPTSGQDERSSFCFCSPWRII